MKRIISMILTIAMMLSMGCMLTGCDKATRKVIGTWKADVDITEAMNESFADSLSTIAKGAASYFNFKGYSLTFEITFRKDGTYTRSVDKNSVNSLYTRMWNDIYNGLEKYFRDTFKKQGLTGSVNDILRRTTGKSLKQIVDLDIMANLPAPQDMEAEEGCYVVQDNMIFFSLDKKTKPDGTNYDTFHMHDGDLVLEFCFCSMEPEEKKYNDLLYPMIFKKQ